MSGQQRLPVEIDPFRMAELGRRYSGQVEIGHLKRLLPLLESSEGTVEVELAFDVDEMGIRYLRGHFKTQLDLMCQRCLGKMSLPLESDFQLAIIQSDSESENLPEIYEPLVVETTPLFLLDVIEDEILLSVPQIPMHEGDSCSVESVAYKTELVEEQNEEETKTNPFAVLEKLKKDH